MNTSATSFPRARPGTQGRGPSRCIGALLASTIVATAASAHQPSEPIEHAVQAFLEHEVQGMPGDIRIGVNRFDPTNRLPACASIVPFLPPGVRPWGAISVGIRCDAPMPWTAYVQARVQVFGPYLVAARALRSSERLDAVDVEVREGELSALPDNVLSAPEQAVGHITRFAVAEGMPLRASVLRQANAVSRGRPVQVYTQGEGFTVSGEGQALNDAAPGERVRVRLPGGQIVHGVARADGGVMLGF